VKDVTIKRFKATLRIAHLLDAAMVVFHSGYEKWKYDHRIDIWLKGSIETWQEILTVAESYNLRLAIENIFEDSPENLRQLMEALDSDYIGLCFDTGHFNLFSKVPLTEWLDTLGRYIYELHIHDNDGSRDQHLAPGKGTFDFDTMFEYFERISKRGLVITVEAHSVDDAIDALRYFSSKRYLILQDDRVSSS
jgi:sugar phosphate isomerase/epimerase